MLCLCLGRRLRLAGGLHLGRRLCLAGQPKFIIWMRNEGLYIKTSPFNRISYYLPGDTNTYITQFQWFMYENRSEHYLMIFDINCTANVCCDFIQVGKPSDEPKVETLWFPSGIMAHWHITDLKCKIELLYILFV